MTPDELRALCERLARHGHALQKHGGLANAVAWLHEAEQACDALPALLDEIKALKAENHKLKVKSELDRHAVNRWVPCPDHRDKINPGHEEPRCYVCLNEAKDAEIKRLREALTALTNEVGDILRNTDSCGDPWVECPLQDAHKDWSTAGHLQKARIALKETADDRDG